MSKETIIQGAKENGKFLGATGLQSVVRLIKKFVEQQVEKLRASISSLIEGKQNKLTFGRGLTLTEHGELSVTLDTTLFKVVLALPEHPDEVDLNKIFVVIPEDSDGKNHKEYIWLPKSQKWEVFGSFSPEVDLASYVKTEVLNALATELRQELASKAQVSDLESRIAKLEVLVNGYTSGILVEPKD